MDVSEILANATFYTDDEPYLVLKLPAAAITLAAGVVAEISDPFSALVVDKDEVTLVVPHEAIEEFSARLSDLEGTKQHYRLITIDVVLPPTLIGFMARISAALAEAGVPIFPFSAYSRDHLLVPAEHFDTALAALNKLKG